MNKNVVFGTPYITKTEDCTRVNCDITGIKEQCVTLWYEVDNLYSEFLVSERLDGFFVGMLPYLMVHASPDGTTTVTLEAPISAKLFYQLTRYYIKTLSNFTEVYNNFTLICDKDSQKLNRENAIATGISGGVDSFYTALSHLDEELGKYKLTHGLYCNVGYLGGFEGKEELAQYNLSNQITTELGLSFISVKSNICQDIYKITHAMIIVNMFASFPLILQKIFSVYYMSSEVSFSDFALDADDAEHFDLLNAHCFSTESLDFYSAGSEVTRIEKTNYIADFDVAREKLFVCRNVKGTPLKNCSRCSKCTRTMVQLDVLGKLDLFEKVFDVDAFRRDPSYYYGYFIFRGKKHVYNKETFEEMKKRGKRIKIRTYLAGYKKIIKNGFKRENPLAKSYRP